MFDEGERIRNKTNQTKTKTQTKHQNKKTSRKLQSFALYVRVRHGETWETLQPATRASNSRIICCSCLWSDFARSGLVRTSLIAGARHRSARKALHSLHWMSIQQSANGKAVSEGSQGVRFIMDLLECNAFLTLENSPHLVTIISHNCSGRRNCGLWWACAVAGHCTQVRQQASDENSLDRGRSRTHIQQAP